MKISVLFLTFSLLCSSTCSLVCQQCTGTGYECQDGSDNGLGTECAKGENCWFQHGNKPSQFQFQTLSIKIYYLDYSYSPNGQDRYVRMCGKGLEPGCAVEAGVILNHKKLNQ